MIETSLESKIEQESYEIENHHHNYEKWFGLAGTPDGETHRADRITLKPEPFQVDAGNDDFGSWLQIIGSSDTPVISTNTFFDFRELLIISHERNSTPYVLQFACGESSELAGQLTAETFTEEAMVTGAGNSETGPIIFLNRRVASGSKIWVRIWSKGQNTGTLDFYIGIHEYER